MKQLRKYNLIKIIIILLYIIIVSAVSFNVLYYKNKLGKEKEIREAKKNIINHYNKYVVAKENANIYQITNNEVKKIGTIGKNVELTLGKIYNKYFEITDLDNEYYIEYDDVSITYKIRTKDMRYKKYIPFNYNVITNDKTELYNEAGELYLELYKGLSLPIIIKKEKEYGVDYHNRLLFIKKDNTKLEKNDNSDKLNAKGVPVLNYHFINEDNDFKCNQKICLSESNFRKHLDYIRDNNYFTLRAKELEMYIDGEIQLPKSVLITFDDGPYFYNARRIIDEYKLNGTYFFVTKWLEDDLSNMESNYMELHSHTNDLHNTGKCPGGQGGGIKCLDESIIQEDLKTSREKLNNSPYIAYPFYEYNNYSIEQLKKAGFTMAFGGYYENRIKYAKPGIDKYKVPRLVISNTTSVTDISNYLTLK